MNSWNFIKLRHGLKSVYWIVLIGFYIWINIEKHCKFNQHCYNTRKSAKLWYLVRSSIQCRFSLKCQWSLTRFTFIIVLFCYLLFCRRVRYRPIMNMITFVCKLVRIIKMIITLIYVCYHNLLEVRAWKISYSWFIMK